MCIQRATIMASELSLLASGLGHMSRRGPTSPRPPGGPPGVADYTWDLPPLGHPEMASFEESFLNNTRQQHPVSGGSFQQSQDSLPCQVKGPFTGLLAEAEPMFAYPSTPFRTTLPDGLNDPYLMGNAEALSNLDYGNTVNGSVSKDCTSQEPYHCTGSNMKMSHGSVQLTPPSSKHEQRKQSYLQLHTESNETNVGDQERMSKNYQHFPNYAWSAPSHGNGQNIAVTQPHKSQFDTQNDSQQNGTVSPQYDRFDHESEWTTMSRDQSPRTSMGTASPDTSLDGQAGNASAVETGQECGNLLSTCGVHQEFVPELSFRDRRQQSTKSPNEKQNSDIPCKENKRPSPEKLKELPLSLEEEPYQKGNNDTTSQGSPVRTCHPLGNRHLMGTREFGKQVACQQEELTHKSLQPDGTQGPCSDTTGRKEYSCQVHDKSENTSQCTSTGTEITDHITMDEDDNRLLVATGNAGRGQTEDTTKAGSSTMAMGSGLRCVGFGCSRAPVPGSIYCSNRCILKHAAYAIQRLEKSREMHANGGKPTTVVSVKQEIISFVVANDKVKKRSSVVPDEVIMQTSAAPSDDVESEKEESIIPPEPRRAALNSETEEGSTRNRKAQPTHEGEVIPSGVFYKPANDNKEARLRDTLYILRKERTDSRQSLAYGKKRRLAPREPRDKKEMKNLNSNEIEGEAQQHCNPAKVAKAAAVDWQIRQTVRKAFRDTLLKRFKEIGGPKVNMKDVARLALQIEKELYAFLGHAESKYKTKYRTLSFNLKDQKNKGLCGQVLAGEVSPHTVVRMSPQQMASQELAEWRARENKHMIELIEKEQQQMEKRPITKTTHKGLVEIGDVTSLVDMQNSTLEREVDKRSGRKAFLQRSSAPLDAAKQGTSQLSDHNWKLCKVKDTDEPSSKKAKPAASTQQAELGKRASQHPPASADMAHGSSPDAGPPPNGEAGDADGGEAAESAAADSHKSPQVSGASPRTSSSPAPTEVSHNDDIHDSLEVVGNDDGDDGVNRDGDETTCGGGPAPSFQQDATGGQPTRSPREESSGLMQKIRGSRSLCDAMAEIVQGPLVDVYVSELPCKPLNESDCEEKWISSPVTDTQQLPHIRSPEKGKDAKAASLPGEIWKGFIGLPNVAKVVMKAYPVSGPTDNLTEDLPDSIQIGGRIHPQVVWDYLYKLKATPSKEACIIRFVPASVEERDGYQSVFSYLSGRKRYGVISNNSHSVKDLYIIPTGAGQKFPSSLISLLGPGLNNTEAGAIVGVLVRQKGKRQQADEQVCEGPADCRAEQRVTKTCDAQRRAHPPNACPRCTGASHSTDARNPKACKSCPESKCDQGGAARKGLDNNSKAECASTGKISPIAEPTHHGSGREPADPQQIARGDCQLSQQQPPTGTATASDRPQSSSFLGSEEHAQRSHSVKTSTRGCNPVQAEQTGKFNNETPILNFKLNQKYGLAGKNVDVKSNGVPGEVFPHSAVIQHHQDAAQIINKQPLKGNKRAEAPREPVPVANNPGGQVFRRLLFSTAAVSEKGHGLASTEINPTRSQTDVTSTPNATTVRAPRDPRTRRPGAFPNVPVVDARHAAAVRGAVKENGQGNAVPRNVTEGLSVRECADVQSCRANNDSNPLITRPPDVPRLSNAIQKRVSAPRLPLAQELMEAGRVFECEPMENICAVGTTRGDVSPPVNARVPPPSEEALGQMKALLPTPPPHSHVPPDVMESPPRFYSPPPRCPPGPPPFPIGLFPPLEPLPFEQPFFEYYDPRPRLPARMPFHHLAQEFHPRWFHPFHQPRWPAVGPLFRPYSVRPPRRRFPRAIDDV
uniref:Uncharacterized protein LOC116941667 n=1 Tax=Petromyzon marinus TaxID=7757 RepID=A0AAJ7WT55_PETMA|nr:uncharacterized protein LOC116941667 [Petromyzon marinus]